MLATAEATAIHLQKLTLCLYKMLINWSHSKLITVVSHHSTIPNRSAPFITHLNRGAIVNSVLAQYTMELFS